MPKTFLARYSNPTELDHHRGGRSQKLFFSFRKSEKLNDALAFSLCPLSSWKQIWATWPFLSVTSPCQKTCSLWAKGGPQAKAACLPLVQIFFPWRPQVQAAGGSQVSWWGGRRVRRLRSPGRPWGSRAWGCGWVGRGTGWPSQSPDGLQGNNVQIATINNDDNIYNVDGRIYLNLSKSIQRATGLKALKLAANGHYLMCKSLPCCLHLLYRSTFILL